LYDVTFTVLSEDLTPLENAEILVNSNSLFTDDNGQATISLPEGENSYTIMLDGYSPVSNTINLTESTSVDIELSSAETYSVTFELVSRHDENPLPMAMVELADYGAKLTDTNGEVVFTGVLPSVSGLDYEISKNTYHNTTGITSPIPQGDNPVITLDTLDIVTYNVTIQVTDGSTAIEEAEVTLANDTKLTSSNGFVLFEEIIPNNEINLSVTKEGYLASDTLVAVYNANVRRTIALEAEETSVSSFTDENFTVFPNPTNGIIRIEGEKPFKFDIFDITGRLMLSESNQKPNHYIDISNYPKGIYLVKINSGTAITTKRIVKQ
ncbi:MAG: T9SS type A sorting domain-containing protein, partial [Perlabentimonas sp.]